MKRWVANLILVVLSIALTISVAEIVLRLAGISYPHLTMPDEHRGYSHLPGAEGWWRKEGNAYIQINSHGLRDREYSLTKPNDTFRIAVLGDSVAEAFQVSLEDAFHSVIERELTNCSGIEGRNVEVVNFGVSGYGTAQELLTLQHKVWSFDPDLVLLAFTTANDIMNNSSELDNDVPRPYFTLDYDKLVIDDSFKNARRYKMRDMWYYKFFFNYLIQYSRTLQVLDEARRQYWHTSKRAHEVKNKNIQAEAGLSNLVYLKPGTEEWEDAWRVTESLLVMMSQEVNAHGARFLVAVLDTGRQVFPDASQRAELIDNLKVTDLFYPNDRLVELGEKENIVIYSLGRPMQVYADSKNVYLHGFENTYMGYGHWNESGHKLAGNLITEQICKMLK